MPAYSAGTSCFFIQSGILRPQQMKSIKDVLALLLSLRDLGYFAFFYCFSLKLLINKKSALNGVYANEKI